MKTTIWAVLIITVVSMFSGCASRCNSQGSPSFGEWIRNRPRPIADLFNRGGRCDNCNVPAGQLSDPIPMMQGHSGCVDGNCGVEFGTVTSGYYPSDSYGYSDSAFVNPMLSPQTGSGTRNSGSLGELVVPPMSGNGSN